jgi:putative phage-type endonuclease
MKPFELLNLEQGSTEWKAERLKRCTASQVPVLFNLSPYQTTLQLFEEKILGEEAPTTKSQELLFARGHEAEAVGRKWVQEKLGVDFKPAVALSLTTPDLLASLDGFDLKRNIIFEAKYMGKESLENVKKGIIKPNHAVQVQAQLLVTGAEKCVYFAMDGNDAAMTDIYPDNFQDDIPRVVEEFMKCVREGKAPEPSDRDFYSPDDERFKKLFELKLQADHASDEFDKLKAILAAEYNHRRIKASGILMFRSVRKGNIQYGKIPDLKNIDLEQYRGKAIETISVKLEKGKVS